MNILDIIEKVKATIYESINIDKEIKLSDNIIDDFGADSIERVNLIMNIEKEFGIFISDDNAESIKTVDDIVNIVYHLIDDEKYSTKKDNSSDVSAIFSNDEVFSGWWKANQESIMIHKESPVIRRDFVYGMKWCESEIFSRLTDLLKSMVNDGLISTDVAEKIMNLKYKK